MQTGRALQQTLTQPQLKPMAETVMGFTMPKTHSHNPPTLQTIKTEMNLFPKTLSIHRFSRLAKTRSVCCLQQRNYSFSRWNTSWPQVQGKSSKRGSLLKTNALPDWPLLAVMVQHIEGQRDYIVHKTVWHLNDETLKNVYTMYIMFTCWGCCFFGSTKDPYYDGEQYRKDGGDGTGHWVYEKQEEIEERARAELWREELIEEIEQKVGGLRELEEAGKKKEEELV